jgi:hypothetical protein
VSFSRKPLALLVAETGVFVAFLLGQVVLHRKHLNVSVTDTHALRTVACAGLFMAVVALFALALYLVVFVGLGAWRALRDA